MNRFAQLSIGFLLVLAIAILSLVLQLMGIGKEKVILPNVSVESLSGEPLVLSDLEATPRVIHLFSTNRHDLELLSQAVQSAKYQSIDYLFLAVQTPKETALQDALSFGISQDLIFLDERSEAANALNYASLPSTLFVNRQGLLIKSRAGFERLDFLESDLDSILR